MADRPGPMAADSDPTNLRAALGTTLIGGAGFILLATWLVPWQPVPGGMPDPVAIDSVFSGAQIERAEDYARWARLWGWGALGVSLAVAGLIGFTSRGRALVQRLRGPWWAKVMLAVALLTLIGRAATLPFSAALRQLQLDAGLSTSTWPQWTLDLLKSDLVTTVITSVAMVILVGAARRWPRAWAPIAGSALGALVLCASFVYPLAVEPLFNSFSPLEDRSLREGVLTVAEREGVDVDDVLVADASRRTTTLNAYVSGFGGTRRVVLYDTLVDDLPEDQVLAVVAHELAHARHDDVLVGTLLGVTAALLGVGLLGLFAIALERRGLPGVGQPTAVPMILALVLWTSVLTSPVESGISRRVETRADVVALEATVDRSAFVALQRRLALRSLADPTPPAVTQWWFGSHPTVLERIALARRR